MFSFSLLFLRQLNFPTLLKQYGWSMYFCSFCKHIILSNLLLFVKLLFLCNLLIFSFYCIFPQFTKFLSSPQAQVHATSQLSQTNVLRSCPIHYTNMPQSNI